MGQIRTNLKTGISHFDLVHRLESGGIIILNKKTFIDLIYALQDFSEVFTYLDQHKEKKIFFYKERGFNEAPVEKALLDYGLSDTQITSFLNNLKSEENAWFVM